MPNGEEDEPAGVGDRRGSGALQKSSKSMRDCTMCQTDASLRPKLKGWYRYIRFRRAKSFNDSWQVPGAEQTSAPEEHQLMVMPPSTLRMWPVMNEAASDAMKTIASACSAEMPRRAMGTCFTSSALFSAV